MDYLGGNPWANWHHSGAITIPVIFDYEFEHDVVMEQLKSGEIQKMILDQYTGNMLIGKALSMRFAEGGR